MAGKQTFETELIKHDKLEATGIEIPFDVEAVFGAKRIPVKAVINGAEYRGSIVRMGGAKARETRLRRIAKAVDMIAAMKKK